MIGQFIMIRQKILQLRSHKYTYWIKKMRYGQEQIDFRETLYRHRNSTTEYNVYYENEFVKDNAAQK